MYQSKFIQLFAVISLTTIISACGDKPKEKELTQAPQEETQTSVKVNPEELNIAEYDAETQTNDNIGAETAKTASNDSLQKKINELDTELEKASENIQPTQATTEVATTEKNKQNQETKKTIETEKSANNMQVGEEELSDLEKEAMAMADDVN